MVPVTNIWKMVLDLLVPQHARVARFDTLRPAVIARTATTAHVVRAIPCIAPFPYDHRIVRDAVHAAKFHGHQRAAWILGAALAPFVAEELADHRMLGEFLSPAIVPVPLHATRLRERGYNQAERIAHSLLHELADETTHLEPSLLVRGRNTEHQTRQHDRASRRANVKDAFNAPSADAVRGARDIILLDDVVTTGATLAAARSTLLRAGARNVLCVAVAH